MCSLNTNGSRFLWVKFQVDDLCDAESDAEIKRVLNDLPKDLSETYARLLGRITGSQRQELAKRMFKWIICARRPLHVEELREAIAFTLNDRFFDREKLPTDMPRLIRGCGNLVVIDEDTQQVQLAHYTVQQYILLEEQTSQGACRSYHFTYSDANTAIGEVCVAYLSFSEFERQVSKSIHKDMAEMAVLQKATATGTTSNLGPLGNRMRQAWSLVHGTNPSPGLDSLVIDYQRLLKRHAPSQNLSDSYRLLSYVIENWLPHTSAFGSIPGRRMKLFQDLLFEKQLPFTFRPWDEGEGAFELDHVCLLGWALEHDHVAMLQAVPDSLPDQLAENALESLQRAYNSAGWSNRTNNVSSAWMNTIENLTHLRIVAGAIDKQLAWLYSKLILACRQGNLEVIRYCFNSCIPHGHDDGIAFALNHMLSEAVVYGQLELVTWITAEPSSAYLRSYYFVNDYSITEYGSYECNAMDMALFRGHTRIANLLSQKSFEVISTFKILSEHMKDVLNSPTAVGAILEVLPPITKNIQNREMLCRLHYSALSEAARSGDEILIKLYNCDFGLEQPTQLLSNAVTDRNAALVGVLIDARADPGILLSIIDNVEMDSEFLEALVDALEQNTASNESSELLHQLRYKALSRAALTEDESRIKRYVESFELERPIRPKMTPLLVAADEKNSALVKVLACAGANTKPLLRYVLQILLQNIDYIVTDTAMFVAMLKVLPPQDIEKAGLCSIGLQQAGHSFERLIRLLSYVVADKDAALVIVLIKALIDVGADPHILLSIIDNVGVDFEFLEALVDAFEQNMAGNESSKILHKLRYIALSQAALTEDESRIKRYVESFELEGPIRPRMTPLLVAAYEKNSALVRVLACAGADTKPLSQYLLRNIKYFATDATMLDVMLKVLRPQDVEGAGLYSIELLQAVHSQDKPRIYQLIQSHQVLEPSIGLFPPLTPAVLESSPSQMMTLIDARACLEEGQNLEAAAWLAIRKNNLECLRLLAELGADLTTHEPGSLSLLDHALQNYQPDIAIFLFKESESGREIPCSHYSLSLARGQCRDDKGVWDYIKRRAASSKRSLNTSEKNKVQDESGGGLEEYGFIAPKFPVGKISKSRAMMPGTVANKLVNSIPIEG